MIFKVKPNHASFFLFTALTLAGIAWGTSAAGAQEVRGGRLHTIVIDPGHGGKDPGCMDATKKIKEKDIALSVALKLGKLIEEKYPDVKVLYTRSKDVYLPLDQRAAKANKNNAQLFLSIHVNAHPRKGPSGTETFVMGPHKTADNLAVCQAENAVIVLEEDYSAKYEGYDPNSPESFIIFNLLQNAHLEQSLQLASCIQESYGQTPIRTNRGVKQGGLLVLWKASCAAVLTEIGFISNPADNKVISSKDGQNKIAKKLLAAFDRYKQKYEADLITDIKTGAAAEATAGIVPAEATTDKVPETEVGTRPAISYRVQILAATKEIPPGAADFKGHKGARHFKQGKYHKYTLGDFATLQEAKIYKKKLLKTFPQAFIIGVQGDTVIPYYRE